MKTMEIRVDGSLPNGVTAKDMILGIIGRIGVDGATGYAIEYTGEAIRGLSMEGRMTVCNMSIEAGARVGMVAPDEKTFDYIRGRPFAPDGREWDEAVESWKQLPTDQGARYDKSVTIDASELEPYVTWGTNPGMVVPVTGQVPNPNSFPTNAGRAAAERALEYMALEPDTAIQEIKLDRVFIGSCTNARIEDLRAAAAVARGRQVADGVLALVVPGSTQVKIQAEEEGLDRIFTEAGFEWREAGCSMCLGMNPDILQPGERCASSSNRNFEGRQGKGGRTHLVSPQMAAAAAISWSLRGYPRVGIRLMEPFRKVTGIVLPLDRTNVDTDSIVPARFLKRIARQGWGETLFYDWRYRPDGEPDPDFVLNQPGFEEAKVLVAGRNFGSGSSREHAVWALRQYRLPCGDQSQLCRYLPQELFRKRTCSRDHSGREGARTDTKSERGTGLRTDCGPRTLRDL